jgi:hypothetical protein
MKKNVSADNPFTLNAHVWERLQMWEGSEKYDSEAFLQAK